MNIRTPKIKITNPVEIAGILTKVLNAEDENDQQKEHCWVIGLRTSKVIEFLELVSLGSLTAGIVHPREVFRMAILKSVDKIVIGHNHPSSALTPSKNDLDITERLVKAGQILSIELLDHIIISLKGEFYSFLNNNLINKLKEEGRR